MHYALGLILGFIGAVLGSLLIRDPYKEAVAIICGALGLIAGAVLGGVSEIVQAVMQRSLQP